MYEASCLLERVYDGAWHLEKEKELREYKRDNNRVQRENKYRS